MIRFYCFTSVKQKFQREKISISTEILHAKFQTGREHFTAKLSTCKKGI